MQEPFEEAASEPMQSQVTVQGHDDAGAVPHLALLSQHIEALIFAAGEPVPVSQLRRVLRRAPIDFTAICQEDAAADEATAAATDGAAPVLTAPADADAAAPNGEAGPAPEVPDGDDFALIVEALGPAARDTRPKTLTHAIKQALQLIERRWQLLEDTCGFAFVEVAGGYTFRTRPAFGATVACLKEERPARLSRPAMESLAIVAYRQPVTKPEVDALRGVDCGGTLKVLLDRRLIAVVGKKEEPGRPLLYGTTDAFLSLFNLANLSALPSLREFNELNVDSEDALRAFDSLPSLAELSAGQKQFRMDEAPSIDALDAAVERLKDTEGSTRSMLLEHGVRLADGDAQADADATGAQSEPPSQGDRPTGDKQGHDTLH